VALGLRIGVTTAKPSKYLGAFRKFIADIRIKSKEIHSTDPRGVPLRLWTSQRRFVDEIGQGFDNGIHKFNCLKSRQLGATTVSLAIDVFWLAVHDNLIGTIVSDNEDNRNKNRSTIKSYIESFEDGYFGSRFEIVTDNRSMMQFSNGSRVDFKIAGVRKKSLAWAEGEGYVLLHLTELAKYADPEGVKSLEEGMAQTNPFRLMMCESTAMGYNHWRDRWISGQNKVYTERSFFLGWWSNDMNRIERDDPRFKQFGRYAPIGEERAKIANVKVLYDFEITQEQLAWIRWKESDAGAEQDLLSQNQPWTSDDAFVQTGRSFFQIGIINKDAKDIMDRGKADPNNSPYRFNAYIYDFEGDFFSFRMDQLSFTGDNLDLVQLKVWEEPVRGARYVVGCDPAWGRNDHKDGSAILVWRCFADRLVQVAEFHANDVDLRHVTWVLFHLGAAYGDAMLNVELAGPGRAIMLEFKALRELLAASMNRTIVMEREWTDAAANARWFLDHKADSLGSGFQYNMKESFESQRELMHGFRSSYIGKELVIKSLKLLSEMTRVVIDESGHIGAPESSNEEVKDDRVYAGALARRAWWDWVKPDMVARGLTYDRVLKEESGEATATPRLVESLVKRFLARQEAEANKEPPRGSQWHQDQGLV
jgi:hypothetical protein